MPPVCVVRYTPHACWSHPNGDRGSLDPVRHSGLIDQSESCMTHRHRNPPFMWMTYGWDQPGDECKDGDVQCDTVDVIDD